MSIHQYCHQLLDFENRGWLMKLQNWGGENQELGRVETQQMKILLVDSVGFTVSLSHNFWILILKKKKTAFVFKLILSYFLGYSHQPTPNFEFSMEELSWYIMYVITNLFHEFRTPNLIAKYHMVVLTLSDQVAKGC